MQNASTNEIHKNDLKKITTVPKTYNTNLHNTHPKNRSSLG